MSSQIRISEREDPTIVPAYLCFYCGQIGAEVEDAGACMECGYTDWRHSVRWAAATNAGVEAGLTSNARREHNPHRLHTKERMAWFAGFDRATSRRKEVMAALRSELIV